MKSSLATSIIINEITDLRLIYFKETYQDVTESGMNRLRDENNAYLEEHLGRDCYVSYVAHDDKPVSCAYMNVYKRAANRAIPNGLFSEIYGVYTLPSYRNNGFARHNMKLLIDLAKNLGVSLIRLDSSLDGVILYKELGFIADDSEYISMIYRL